MSLQLQILMKPTEKEKARVKAYFLEAEQRIMRKIQRRMRILAKDKKLKKEMENDIKKNLKL